MFRRRLRLSAAAGAGLLIAAVAAVPASTAAPVADEPVADVTIDSFSPAAPKVGRPVTITGRVTNTSTVGLDNPQAIACINRDQRLDTPAELAAVPAEDDKPMDERRSCSGLDNPDSTTFQAFGPQLAPKASVPFKLVVPWKEWKISQRAGVYVVGVLFRGNPADGTRITAGRARTLMPVIDAKPLPRKVNTAMVLPLRHRPTLLSSASGSNDRYANESLARSMTPTGELGRLLAAGRKKRVTWLVDPAMLDEVRGMADGYKVLGRNNQTKPGTGQKIAQSWLNAFNATRTTNPVILLPYGDPDVAGLLDAGGSLRELVGQSRAATEQFNLRDALPFRSGLWLENGSATGRNLVAASTGYAGAKADDVNLVPSFAWPAADRPTLFPSPVYDVSTPAGPVKTVRTVVADSNLLAGGPDPASASEPVQVRQRFAAETALLASTGTGSITVVAAPPRAFDPTGKATATLMQGLSLPWITPIGVDKVLNGAPAKPQLAKPPTAPRVTTGLTGGQLDQIKRLSTSTRTFTSLLANPDNANDNLRRALLRAGSSSWRGFTDEAQRFVGILQFSVDNLLGKVHLVNTSGTHGSHHEIKVNLSGSKGTFPLTIANELDQSVRVSIVVTSVNRPDLRIEPLQSKVLAAGQKATYQINASAEQNGLIRADAQVISGAGLRVGKAQELIIQAAQYGSVGWVLVGAAIALLFGTSAVRIYRRIRSERRNPSTPATDPLHPAPLDPSTLEAAPGKSSTARASALEPDPLDPPGPNGVPGNGRTTEGAGQSGSTRGAAPDVPRSMKEGVEALDG